MKLSMFRIAGGCIGILFGCQNCYLVSGATGITAGGEPGK
jgi:hypothetical protein